MIDPEQMYPGNRYLIEFHLSKKSGIFTGEIIDHQVIPKIVMNGIITSRLVFYGFKNIDSDNSKTRMLSYFFQGNSINGKDHAIFKEDSIIREKDKANKQANMSELRDFIKEKKIEPYGPSNTEYKSRISFFGELYRETKARFINLNKINKLI